MKLQLQGFGEFDIWSYVLGKHDDVANAKVIEFHVVGTTLIFSVIPTTNYRSWKTKLKSKLLILIVET